MKLDWMGEYRDVVGAMIGMCNAYYRVYNSEFINELHLSPAQLQVMEYILENEESHDNMSAIAKRLSISQSSFSKIANQLVRRGFLEKYHLTTNGKNVIIRVSDYGRRCYAEYSRGEMTDVWRRIFKKLDTVDSGSVQVFVDCLNEFTEQILPGEKTGEPEDKEAPRLIRME